MSKTESASLKSLAWPTYFVAFLLVATPALDFLTNIWPLHLSNVQWRYGSVGLLAGFLLTPLFGIMFALGAALVLRHRLVLRVVSYLNLVSAVLILVLVGLFALDVLEVRATVPEEARAMFRTGAAKAAVKYVTMAGALGWLGIAGVRATRSWVTISRTGGKPSSDVPLVRAAEEK